MRLIQHGGFVFAALAIVALLGACATSPNPAPATVAEAAEHDLPLRVSWVKTLVQPQLEDRWRPMQYGTPVVHEGVVYLGNNDSRFFAFRSSDGATLWRFDAFGPIESAAVIVGENVIFGDSDGLVYCLDRATGFVKWTYRVQGQVMGHLVSDGELVFVRTNHERLYAITLADGKWKWMQSRQVPNGFTIRGVASPVIDGNRILVGYADGYFLAYRTTDGAEMFKTLLEKGERFIDVDTTPLVENGRIFVAGYNGNFYCLNSENAAIQWTYRHGGIQKAAVVGDFVYAGDDAGQVHALDKKTGQEAWTFDLREADKKQSIAKGPRRRLKAPTNALPFEDYLLIGSSDGFLFALALDDGSALWSYWPGFGITAELVTDGGAVYIHTNYGNLYCLKPNYQVR